MSSRAHVMVDTPTLVLVEVTHGPRDSFSRSVTPAATRQWNRSIHRSSATSSVSYEFAVEGLGNADTCVSYAAFAPSFEDARAALKSHIAAALAALEAARV